MKHFDGLRNAQSITSCALPAWRNRVRRRILVIPRGASLEDQRMMKRAIELARTAGERGEVPVGAVIYRAGVILSEASNDSTGISRRAEIPSSPWQPPQPS